MVPELFAVWLKRLLPGMAMTRLAGVLARSERPWLARALIRFFLSRYAVNLVEAADPDPLAYPSFNAFFTRALRPDARPLAQAVCICPVDGAISQLGNIAYDQIFQAKGHYYSTLALLGGDSALSAQVEYGAFCTLYLSPKDYHRVHMPCAGRLTRMIHVPGRLLSVNPANARHIPGLFARNERVVCAFESPAGAFIMVLVGATLVGSIATVWHGTVNTAHGSTVRQWDYLDQHIELEQGEEMGRFMLGSTVIMLFPQQPLYFPSDWVSERSVRLGEAMRA